MNKQKIKIILKETLIFIVQIAFSRVQFGQLFPVGFAFALSRVFFGANLLLVSLEYAISNIFVYQNFILLLSVAFEIVVLSLFYFFNEMYKIKRKKLVLFLFLVLSYAMKLYFAISLNIFWREFLF